MRRDPPQREPIRRASALLATASVSLALICAGCGSSSPTTTTAPTTVAESTTTATSHPGGRTTKANAALCLVTHDVPLTQIAIIAGHTSAHAAASNVSDRTLKDAGAACQSALTPRAATAVRKLNTCITDHRVATANTGSPLADLLLLDPKSATVRTAVTACVAAQLPRDLLTKRRTRHQ